MLLGSMTNIQWYGPHGLIPGATGQTYHPTEPGQYYAVQVGNGCNSAPSNKLTLTLLSLGDHELDQVKVFPNPASTHLTIQWPKLQDMKFIRLYNMEGRQVFQEKTSGQKAIVLNVATLPRGVYFLVISDISGRIGTMKVNLSR